MEVILTCYYVKETKGFSLDRVFAHTSILFCTAEIWKTPNFPHITNKKKVFKSIIYYSYNAIFVYFSLLFFHAYISRDPYFL